VVNGDGTTNTTTATDNAQFTFTAAEDTNGDGLIDSVDTNGGSGTLDGATEYTSTYTTNALDANIATCPFTGTIEISEALSVGETAIVFVTDGD
uniref:hypothetical protein n=1 Tax=uncultured Polaribacter sp. TaxID=174711 RepID=UPI00262E6775